MSYRYLLNYILLLAIILTYFYMDDLFEWLLLQDMYRTNDFPTTRYIEI